MREFFDVVVGIIAAPFLVFLLVWAMLPFPQREIGVPLHSQNKPAVQASKE